MSGELCWLAVALALSVCCDGLDYDTTWAGCPASQSGLRVVKRGEPDREVRGLQLRDCNITSLKPNELVYPGLKKLDFGYNNIEFIETGSFDSLGSMVSLYLTSNEFLGEDLSSSLFRNCHRLNAIDFSNNDMSDTPSDLLQGLNNLAHFSCNNCSLHEMPTFISHARLPIELLRLGDNQLTRIDDPATFVNLSSLIYLHLHSNKLDYLHEDLLKPLTKIKFVNLMSNKIRHISEQLFRNKSQLYYINLANNLIDYIPEKAFLGTNLGILDLSDNMFVYLSENLFSELHTNPRGRPKFYFDGNPLPCACLNKLLVKLKQLNIDYEIRKHDIYDGKHVNCVMLDKFKCFGPYTYQYFYKKLISGGK